MTADTLIKTSDVIGHKIHRHEPPCTDEPIKIVHEGDDLLVIDKPGGIPVHPAGRFRHNTVIHVLKKEHNIPKLYRKLIWMLGFLECNFFAMFSC